MIYVLFILGLIMLIKGGDWFVDGATKIAKRFKMSELFIGATIVAIGTTLPEVLVSATSAIEGHSEMAYGNAIGSIICNTALIAAIVVAFKPMKTDRKPLVLPAIFFLIASTIFTIISYTTGYFNRAIGIILLGLFVVYMIFMIISTKKDEKESHSKEKTNKKYTKAKQSIVSKTKQTSKSKTNKKQESKYAFLLELVLLIIGAVLIFFGARLLVDNGTLIATAMGVSDKIIGITFVAIGTSLPELVTAITSLIKGHGSLSVGNIIGANLFNLVLVSGIAITLTPFAIPSSSLIAGINASLIIDIPVMLSVMAILIIPTLITKKLSRWQGIMLLLIYAAFITLQFVI